MVRQRPPGDAVEPRQLHPGGDVVEARRRRTLARLGVERVAAPGGGRHDDVIEAVGRLRAGDREILRLAAWESMSTGEIAVALGCSANAAALRLSRARRRLGEQLTRTATSRTQPARKVIDA